MIPAVFIFAFLTAAALLVFGMMGLRIGDEPRCRKCKYNLTGAVSNKCPKCGTHLVARSVRW